VSGRDQEPRAYLDALRAAQPVEVTNAVLLAQVDSTNLLARRIVAEYLKEEMTPPRVALLAFEQSAGRGRHGRTWASPAGGGVYASLLVPGPSAEVLAALPLAVGIGLCDALRAAAGVECRLKWPNDVLLGGRKLGGVLVETIARGDTIVAAVVGFGINRTAEGLPAGATALAEHTTPPPLAGLAWTLVSWVLGELAALARTGDAEAAAGSADLGELMRRYRELSVHRPGDRLAWQLGDERGEGTFLGFDEHGHLRVDAGGRERRLTAGEVLPR
jgi:BirA family biotin operon repressor/biotin-[acetyl-CoA-carboxylase] ligase